MKDKLKAIGLDDEMVTKVDEVLKAELKDRYVPLERFNTVNERKNKLEEDVNNLDSELEKLKKSNDGIDSLKEQIEALQNANKAAQAEYDAKIKAIRTEDFVKTKLMEAGLIDAKYIPGVKAYLNLDDLDIDNVKSVAKFDSAISEAKSITSAWFKSDEPPTTELGGLKLNDPTSKVAPDINSAPKDSYEYILSQYTKE